MLVKMPAPDVSLRMITYFDIVRYELTKGVTQYSYSYTTLESETKLDLQKQVSRGCLLGY